jgi:hypothetical protein
VRFLYGGVEIEPKKLEVDLWDGGMGGRIEINAVMPDDLELHPGRRLIAIWTEEVPLWQRLPRILLGMSLTRERWIPFIITGLSYPSRRFEATDERSHRKQMEI